MLKLVAALRQMLPFRDEQTNPRSSASPMDILAS
jgi:hypothetical protein